MSLTLRIRLRKSEGALLRLLGQVGRRGYDILEFTARLAPEGTAYEISLEFEPIVPMAPGKPRPAEVLPALVAKLCDVEKVEFAGKPPAGKGGNGADHGAPKPPVARPAGEMKWEE